MRIKYRAWDNCKSKMFIVGLDEDYTFVKNENGFDVYDHSNDNEQIYHLELMQYTGINDKNGEEIAAGDIVKRKSLALGGIGITGIVKMLEGCWVIDNSHDAAKLWTECDENEILGNIYENTELLEK